jgi:tol-pal system protein YbgF
MSGMKRVIGKTAGRISSLTRKNSVNLASRYCMVGLLLALAACATQQDVRDSSRRGHEQSEAVRNSLEGKLEQLTRTQREAEKTLAKLDQLIEDSRKDQAHTRELAASLNSELRKIRDMDLLKVNGVLEQYRRDLQGLQSRVEDQLASVQSWLATLDQKQMARVDQQVAKVESRLETLDKREAAASVRIQDTLTTLGKKIDDRLEAQDRRIEARIKKVEDDGRAATASLSAHLTEVDKSLAQMSEAMKNVGTKLSTQIEQQGTSLAKLDEASRTLSPRADQLKTSMGELTKVLHTLTEKSAELDRRIAELGTQTDAKIAGVASEQAVKVDKLAKRVEMDGQAVTNHLNTMTQNFNVLAKSLESAQGRVGQNGGAEVHPMQPMQNPPAAQEVQNETQPAPAPVRQPPSETITPKAKLEPPVAPETAYERAYRDFQQGRHDAALTAFRNFLVQHPDSALIANAYFWIGECYVKKRDYSKSLDAYDHVIRNYPKSGKASIALYRKALVLLELNDRPAAKTTLKKLIADYPKSDESKQARNKLAAIP